MSDDLRYPIGKFAMDDAVTPEKRQAWIATIAALPKELDAAVSGLADAQLDTPYRPEGWTVRQLVHHVADSHINAYTRCRLALTEERPRIKTYEEKAWAELDDARTAPVTSSLALLEALHERWTRLLRSCAPEAFARAAEHPELGPITVDWLLQLYAWHGRHHTAHVTRLRERQGWA